MVIRGIFGVLAFVASTATYGDADGIFNQGAALFQSDPEKAYPLFVQAAEEGNVSAMVGVGHCLENGIGTESDYAKAIEWYTQAVAQNNMQACEGLARIHASCPDPQFHDGEKAVKYAEALARKNPKDPQVLALLAAAYARNMEFEQAVRYVGKAAGMENRPDESALLEVRKAAYREGEPYPPVATEEWMLAAVEKKLPWAISRMLWKISEQTHPFYNPDLAIQICKQLVKEGDEGKRYLLGNLYLNTGRLDEARDCLNSYREYCMETGTYEHNEVMRYSGFFDLQDLEWMLRRAELVRDGYEETKTSQNPYPRRYAPDLRGAFFIYRIAAHKGSQAAREKVVEIDYNRGAYRRIMENEGKQSTVAVARALEVEAKKFLAGEELPEDRTLALGIYYEAYKLDPLPDYASAIGDLSVHQRGVKEAIAWWVISAEGGCAASYRSLVRYYACSKDADLLNPAKAMQYALALVEVWPNRVDAQSYLACAYARSGEYNKAVQIMEGVLGKSGNASSSVKERYEGQYRSFKSRKPWVWEE